MEELAARYGVWALLAYIALKDGFGVVRQWLPLHAKERARADDLKRNLDEREVAVLESLNQNLGVMNERMLRLEASNQTMIGLLVTAGQSLVVLIDRVGREGSSAPVLEVKT